MYNMYIYTYRNDEYISTYKSLWSVCSPNSVSTLRGSYGRCQAGVRSGWSIPAAAFLP